MSLDLYVSTDNRDSHIDQISRKNNTRAFWPCRTRVKTHNHRLSYIDHAASAYIQHLIMKIIKFDMFNFLLTVCQAGHVEKDN